MSADLITQFISHLENNNKSKSTIVAYQKDISQLDTYTGDKGLTELSSSDIKQVLEQLREEQGFTAKTISRKLNSFRTFYKYLEQQGKVKINPATEVSHPKVKQKAQRILSHIECLALREVSRPNPRLYTMIELMLQTGLRIGEVARLHVGDLHFETDKGYADIEKFSTNPARRLQMNQKCTEVMQSYLKNIKPEELEAPLFSTRDGKHIIIRNIRSSVDRAMAKAGIEDACVNDLRNTFIVGQLKAGVPVELVAETVGHRSHTTTLKYLDLLEQPYKQSQEFKLVNL